MHTFLTFLKEFKIPRKKELSEAKSSFTRRQARVFITLLVIGLVSMLVIVGKVNRSLMVAVPSDSGTLLEGIIGMPTLVNPVLALSDADKDLTSLVYSGLLRKMPDGSFAPDLAESYSVSSDGMTYTFILKKTAIFQDKTKVTADDVVFTIEKIKDPLIKSPRRIGWDGVSVESKDENTVVFTLKQPYISFLDNTTTGILPMHMWKNVTPAEFGLSNLNIKAIGSGPYKIDSVSENKDGIPNEYDLSRFSDFTLGTPHVKRLRIVSYANENDLVDALASHSIDQAGGISPENAGDLKKAGYQIHTVTLPRIFGLFYNSTHNGVLADKNVLAAFDKALDRQEIVDKVLFGYGTPIKSPVPETILPHTVEMFSDTAIDDAKAILEKAGWTIGPDGIRTKGGTTTVTRTKKVGKKTVTEKVKVNNGPVVRLAFSLTTGDTPELKDSAAHIKEGLEKLGAEVEIKIYETGPLNQLIRSRDYEALFFGQIVNHESDLFSFWHSSQKTDPGLNIALYADKNADSILESSLKTLDRANRIDKYKEFEKIWSAGQAATLIYSPKYLYVTSSELGNTGLLTMTLPADRFSGVAGWYAATDYVWKIFVKK